MDRMPGRFGASWCPYCHRKAGPDCPDNGLDKKQVRLKLKRELRREIDNLTDEERQ